MQNINNSLVKSIEDLIYYDQENAIEYLVMTMFETILKAGRRGIALLKSSAVMHQKKRPFRDLVNFMRE